MHRAGMAVLTAALAAAAGSASAQSRGFCLEVPDSKECATVEAAGAESAAAQASAIGGAIGRATGSRLGSGPEVTQSAKDVAANVAYWVSAGGSSYSGDTEGWQYETVGGIDLYINDRALVGAFIGYGKSEREAITATAPTEIGAKVGGIYFATLLGDTTVLHAYVGGGIADYFADGTDVESDRLMYGGDISWEIDRKTTTLVPFVKLISASDDLPAFNGDFLFHDATTVVGTTASTGLRWEFKEPMGNSDLMPYVSIGADYIFIDPGNDLDSESSTQPRLEAGFSGLVGEGLLSVDLHFGKADEGTTDLGGVVTYSFGF